MYPIQCPGGFAVPIKAGKMEIMGFCVTISDPTANSQFAIIDDSQIKDGDKWGRFLSTLTGQKEIIINMKGLANADTILGVLFDEPIKTRNGISIYTNNILAGSICVYVR